jgi:quinoprotein glucose dehydrogenase
LFDATLFASHGRGSRSFYTGSNIPGKSQAPRAAVTGNTDLDSAATPARAPIGGVVLGLVGIALALPGAKLLSLGGSSFYLLAGAALLIAGYLLWRGSRIGVWLVLLTLVVNLIWAVGEAGFNGWPLLTRTWLFMMLALAVLIRWRRRLPPLLLLLTVVVLVLFSAAAMMPVGRQAGTRPSPPPAAATVVGGVADWPWVGGTERAQRFSELTGIEPANVSKLQVAWTAHLGMPPNHGLGALEGTPLEVDDTLYACSSNDVIVALEADTGRTLWRFDPVNETQDTLFSVCRGVAYFRAQPATTDGSCTDRIIGFARYARMVAVDAHTGKPCRDFGRNGEVNLLEGMGEVLPGYYYQSSAPTIVRGNVIVGGAVFDGQAVGEPSGVIRGYSALTGKLAWAWDMGRPDEHGPPPVGTSYTRGTPNGWGPMTGDESLGLVYVPLGNATPDFVAAHRTVAMNTYSSSVVALDAETGGLRWHFQTVHRDVWDYDVAAAPTLFELPTLAGPVPALVLATKTGQFFVLDRRSGQTLTEVVERPVAHDAAAGEEVAPTQPYSAGMPVLTDRLTESDMWGLTPFDQLWCRIRFKQAHYEGDFTPVRVEPTLIYPGYLGGTNWYGVSVDPERQLMFVNVNHFAMIDRLIPREEADRLNLRPMGGGHRVDLPYWPQTGTQYAATGLGFLSPLQIPCVKPPYHELAAVDLRTHQLLWREPLGTGRDLGPWGIPSLVPIAMGVPGIGGSLATRSGLLFIAATQDRTLRAFDSTNGKLLWEARLPAGGHTSPMTYYSKRGGRQYVLIPASGHIALQSGSADYLIAYALP